MHHILVALLPFHFVIVLIDEVHLFLPDALPIDNFPSPVINASMKGCQPIVIVNGINGEILPVAKVDHVSINHFHREVYIRPLLA